MSSDVEQHQPLARPRGEVRVPASARRAVGVLAAPWVSYVAAFLIALAVYLAAFDNIRQQLPTGDEPSYVLDAMSMARDHDRDLSNNFSYTKTQPLIDLFGVPAVPHVEHFTNAGDILWHGAGVGFLLVPGVWVGDAMGDTLLWMRLELVLLDALAALLLYAVLRRLGSALGIRPVFVWTAWAATALCLELVAYADQFYPEVPALLFTLGAVAVAVRPRPGWKLIALGAASACYLPWLHVRFIPICAGLLGILWLRGLGAVSSPGPSGRLLPSKDELRRGLRAAWWRPGLLVTLAVVVPTVVSFGYMAYKFNYWYGSPGWNAMSGKNAGVPSGTVSAAYYFNVLGGLFSNDYGWVPYAPVFILSLAAVGCLFVVGARWATIGVAICLLYQYALGATAIMTPGFVFPGRYELVWMPFLSIGLMLVLARIRVVWLLFLPLLALSLTATYQASQRSGFVLLNTGTVGLPIAMHLQNAFPDIEYPPAATSYGGDQTAYSHMIGKINGRKEAVATPKDGAGYLTFGPRVPLAAGTYVASYNVQQRGAKGNQPVVRLDIFSLPGLTVGAQTVRATDARSGKNQLVTIPFGTPGNLAIETRAYVYGNATVKLGPMAIANTSLFAPPDADAHPQAALMFGWIFAIVILGAFLVSLLRAQRFRGPPSALA